jgi:hypothetical protein
VVLSAYMVTCSVACIEPDLRLGVAYLGGVGLAATACGRNGLSRLRLSRSGAVIVIAGTPSSTLAPLLR